MIPKLQIVAIRNFTIPKEYRKQIGGHKFFQGTLESLEEDGQKRLKVILGGHKPLFFKMAYVVLGAKVEDSAFGHIKKLQRTKEGFLTVSTHQETNVPGLYAVGDCVHGLSQVSVAVGQAAIAAVHANNSLVF